MTDRLTATAVSDEILGEALKAIGQKERTVAEMERWLDERGVEAGDRERVLAYLTENLALDDARFAEAFTADKRRLSGWGNDRIEETLRKRGIDSSLIRKALAQPDEESEVDRAVRVLKERRVSLDDDRGRQKALGMLARRGYSAEEAYDAIRRLRPAV